MARSLAPMAAIFLALTSSAFAAGGGQSRTDAEVPPSPIQTLRVVGPDGAEPQPEQKGETEVYCENIADTARDTRYAIADEQLRDLETQIEARIADLEARRSDYLSWLEERKRFLDSASSVVVSIYSAMRADAAAAQLSRLDKDGAASVLVKLKSRQASDILSEMSPDVAAEIAGIIVAKTASGETGEAAAAAAEGAEARS